MTSVGSHAPARYGVIGNPIAHSRSPQIHQAFAAQENISLSYERILAEPAQFEAVVRAFAAAGGLGLNVTVPFKEKAVALAGQVSERARLAGAANTLIFGPDSIQADNTDGVGLVRDLRERGQVRLDGAHVVLIGAGGAARGVIEPVLQAGAQSLVIINRTLSKATELIGLLAEQPLAAGRQLSALSFEQAGALNSLPNGDGSATLLINATAASLDGSRLPLPDTLLSAARLAYDMVYSDQPTAFMTQARNAGCPQVMDGLGMLVEQAAESFRLWHGMRPDTGPVFKLLRPAG